MSEPEQLRVGASPWSFAIPAERRVEIRRAAVAPPVASTAEMTRAALEKPFGFEPLRRALTPDDRVAVVLDPNVPQVGAVLGEVLAHLHSAGIALDAVTVLTPPGSSQRWVDQLADEYADVRTEVHDPADVTRRAYFASTRAGRRLYLNRTVVESDFTVIVSGRAFDPLLGYAGAETALFPALSDEESRKSVAGEFHTSAPRGEPWPVRQESLEATALFGLPFLVQVIEGEGDAVQEIVAGLPESNEEGIRRQDARWRGTVSAEADTAIAAVGGNGERVTFLDLAKAAACAARVVRTGGRIAVLTAAAPELGEGAALLRSMDGPTGARKLLARLKPTDWAASFLWAFSAKKHSMFLASAYPDEVAEGLFATPVRAASEVQRLIDGSESVLLIPDAHKTMLTVE